MDRLCLFAGFCVVVVASACAGRAAPEPQASEPSVVVTPPPPEEPPSQSASAPDTAAPPPSAAPVASAAPPPVYQPPPPVTIRRSYVYAAMDSRAKEKVTIVSLLDTSADAAALAPSIEAELQLKVEPATGSDSDWTPVGTVMVDKIESQGSAVRNNARQLIRMHILTEASAAQVKGRPSPFKRGAKVRLQIDRREEPPTK